jgi:hypothetical protein
MFARITEASHHPFSLEKLASWAENVIRAYHLGMLSDKVCPSPALCPVWSIFTMQLSHIAGFLVSGFSDADAPMQRLDMIFQTP